MSTVTNLLGPEERREIDRMKRALALGSSSEFHMIVGDTRRVVEAALREVLPEIETSYATIRPEESPKPFAERWMSLLEEAIHSDDARPVVLDAWDVEVEHREHWGWIFARLNERRNEIMGGLGRPLVILVSPSNERLLGRTAPDLYSIRRVGMRLVDRRKSEGPPTEGRILRAPPTVPRSPKATTAAPAKPVARKRGGSPAAKVADADGLTRSIEAIRLARRLHEDQRDVEALDAANEAIEGYVELARNSATHRVDLARALHTRARIAAALGRRPAAIGDLLQLTASFEATSEGDPQRSDFQRELMEGYDLLGDLYLALEEEELAAGFHAKASDLRQRSSEVGPARSTVARSHGPPSVFIVYSHESEEHEARVRVLADQLRSAGVDVWLDQYVEHPVEGWPAWIRRRITDAGFVLVICTPTFRRRFEGGELLGFDFGVMWEARIAEQILYAQGLDGVGAQSIVPILFEGDDESTSTPLMLRPYTSYRLPLEYQALLRRLYPR